MAFVMRSAVLCTVVALASSLAPSSAVASTGLAYGSVTKFSMGSDTSEGAPTPGSYRTDFTTASTPQSTGSTPKVPFGLGKMLAKAQSAMAMFKNGTAEMHYIGTTKERVDELGSQTADITDCVARTITHLDLDKKTYSVTSLDQPQTSRPSSGGGKHSEPGPMPTDDGTKVAFVITTRALGPMKIEGLATNGYGTNVKMTVTKPTGESATTDMDITAYYAALDEPHFACPTPASAAAMPSGPAGASMANLALAMLAMRTPKGDPRFSVTTSGPPTPASRFPMWQNVAMTGSASGGGRSNGSINILSERGDLRAPLSDADPIFGIPAGFTKVGP